MRTQDPSSSVRYQYVSLQHKCFINVLQKFQISENMDILGAQRCTSLRDREEKMIYSVFLALLVSRYSPFYLAAGNDFLKWFLMVSDIIYSTLEPSCNVLSSVQFSCSVVSNSCDPMNHSTPGLPVHHQLPEFTQTHVHRVGDAIQPSHPLSYPFPPAPNPSQHQSLFQ